jgi:hypothetical protein
MSDLLLFFGTIVGVIVIVLTLYTIDKMSGCWHKFDKWMDDSTDVAYVQWRSCTKCGYIEREQFRKFKERKDDST